MTYGFLAGPHQVARSPRRLLGLIGVATLLPATAQPQAPPAAWGDAATIDEIIVTARKIEENVQNVPMSVQVLSGDLLDNLNLSHLFELQFNVPGLVVNNVGMFGAGFSLRGIADQSTSRVVAVHVNGVNVGSDNLAISRMFDVERIEVLKGPQGTLYGQNATGGSINLVTRSPDDRLGGEIESAYASFSTVRTQGYLNIPTQQSAAVRLAFIASEGDGYIRNSVDDRRFGEQDFWALRASFRFDVSDTLGLELMAQRVRDDGAGGELWTPNPTLLPDPRDIRLTTVTLKNPHLVTENDVVSLNLAYDLGYATLRSVSGYGRSHVRDLDDCAGLPLWQGCIRGSRPLRHEQWSQEVRLLLPGTGRVEGLVGVFYLDEDEALDFHLLMPLIDAEPLNDYHATSRETAGAVFGQATLHVSERWRLTGGLRYSRVRIRMTTVGTGIQDSATPLRAKHDSDDLSWHLDLSHAASDDLLLYGSVSTGYNSGGFTRTIINGELDSYDPEKVFAIEVGGKSHWLNRRLTFNAAAFYYDYDDMQVSTVTLRGAEVDNAARAEIYGIDAEGVFRVSERWIVSGGTVWLPRREFIEFHDVRADVVLSGNKLSRAPEWTAAVAVGYQAPLRTRGILSGRLEYHYRSSHYYTKENVPQFLQDGFGLLNLHFKFQAASGKWYAFASGRNLTNENYFHQVFIQSSPGYPDTYEIGAGYRF